LDRPARIRGCLLGGAVGDALGAPVEFLTLPEIRARYGPAGIVDYAPAYGRPGAVTDDTQMTLFTAEGCLRAVTRGSERGIWHPPTVLYHAYLRWLRTQGVDRPEPACLSDAPGWLIGVAALHARRAPGTTCLSALASGRVGTVERPINDSKGCGGVMRVAPVGLLGGVDAFRLGCEAAAITHGHPSGYLAAGALAHMVEQLTLGRSLAEAVDSAFALLARAPGHNEVTDALRAAVALAGAGRPAPERVEQLGAGWVAEEALAIGVYSALAAGGDFERGVRLAVNHGGDSDSTGAIAGHLLGTLLGPGAVQTRWLDGLELRAEIEQLAADLALRHAPGDAWRTRYPGC
jgi:ADP-ribosylglycohydrolase